MTLTGTLSACQIKKKKKSLLVRYLPFNSISF